ncbi:MAG: hypothetical protein WC807_17170 [Hyphomicrobium sp.]|jgi:hypothetical protein
MPFWILVIVGLVIVFWRVVVVLAIIGGLGYGLFRLARRTWDGWTAELERQGETEDELKELWARFTDKPIVAWLYYPLMLGRLILAPAVLPFVLLGVGNELTQGGLQASWKQAPDGVAYTLYLLTFGGFVYAAWGLAVRYHNWREPGTPCFGRYSQLLAYVDGGADARTVLERAPALRAVAKQRLWGPRAYHRTWSGMRTYSDHPKFYDSDRLADLLAVLETHFPMTEADEMFRYRYWNYAQPIWRLLSLRGDERAQSSMFGKAYPENPKAAADEAARKQAAEKEQRRQRLEEERARMRGEGQTSWNGSQAMSVMDALDVIGLAEMPDEPLLRKFEAAMMAGAEEDQKAELALAFRVLANASSWGNPEARAH